MHKTTISFILFLLFALATGSHAQPHLMTLEHLKDLKTLESIPIIPEMLDSEGRVRWLDGESDSFFDFVSSWKTLLQTWRSSQGSLQGGLPWEPLPKKQKSNGFRTARSARK